MGRRRIYPYRRDLAPQLRGESYGVRVSNESSLTMPNVDLFYVALAILVLGMMYAAFTRPVNAVYAYLAVIFFFPTVNWGLAAGVEAMNLYSRGTGLFYFSVVNLYLFAIFLLGVFYWKQRNPGLEACNIGKYFWFFTAWFAGNVAVGVALGISPVEIFKQRGVINLLNTGLLTTVLIRAVNTPREMERFTQLILWCGALRGGFGVLRFIFGHGDIANVYENVQHAGIKLTFFDINDSLLACVAGFIAAWRLFERDATMPKRFMYLSLLLLELVIAVFSYRRTAWGGMAMAAVLFCTLQPLRYRIPLFVGGVVAGGAGLTILIAQRFTKVSSGRGILDMLFYDVGGKASEGRFAELVPAFHVVLEHPVLGIGSWGGYGLGGSIEFMHSGLLHIWLRTGLLGLVPFILMFFSYFWFCWRVRKQIPRSHRGLFEAGLAGLIFTLPTHIFGTPVIEFRTMQSLGFCLALPYIVYGIYGPQRSSFNKMAATATRNSNSDSGVLSLGNKVAAGTCEPPPSAI